MNEFELKQLKTMDPSELGSRIRSSRISKGLTQTQLAAGTASIAFVSRIESGKRRPDAEILEGLANTLGVSVSALVFGEDAPGSAAEEDSRLLAAAERDKARLELDFAELEVSTGSAQQALERLDALAPPADADLAQLATLLRALAHESLGRSPIQLLEDLVAQDIRSDEVWFKAHVALCRSLRDSGELESAIAAGEAATARLEARGLTGTDEAIQLAVTLAAAYDVHGEVPKALRICQRALAEAEALGSRRGQASAYWNASICESRSGNITGAIELAQRALLLFNEDETRYRAVLRMNVGSFMLMTEPPDPAAALELLDQAAADLATAGASASDLARSTVARARANHWNGDSDKALELLTTVLDTPTDVSPFLLADGHLLRGQILWARKASNAADEFRQAVVILAGTGQDRSIAKLWYQIASSFEDLGDAAAALDAYRRAMVASGVVPTSQLPRVRV